MQVNKTIEEWVELIIENNVIARLNEGEKFSSINIDVGLDVSSDALRKAIKRIGYKKDKNQGIYYFEHQEDIIKFMNSIDIEERIEQIGRTRYYRFLNDGDLFCENWETEECLIDREVYKEYDELAKQIGGFENIEIEELIHMVLLEWLDKNKPMDKTREFLIRYMKEDEFYTEEEIEFMLQKEKEGYVLESMVYTSEDYNLMELTEEEFNNHISKRN